MVEFIHRGTPQDLVSASRVQALQHQFSEVQLLRQALNQLDYGLAVVDADTGALQFANALARDALEGAADSRGNKRYYTGLCLVDGRVMARRPADAELLHHTLERTKAGSRGLLSLGGGDQHSAVAVIPLSGLQGSAGIGVQAAVPATAAPPCHALLVFAKQQLCDDSTMALFARGRGLTQAEGQVLAQVCRGLRPSEIADHHGVQISTVRTQLRSIRIKTCSETIRELVQKVSVLPPMARHLSAHNTAMA